MAIMARIILVEENEMHDMENLENLKKRDIEVSKVGRTKQGRGPPVGQPCSIATKDFTFCEENYSVLD